MQSLLPYSVSEENILDSIRDIASGKVMTAIDAYKECDIIVPVACNISNNKTTGLLKEASYVFPVLKTSEYEGKQKLGQSNFIKVGTFKNNNIYFCKMFVGKHQRHRRNINYAHLVKCMLDIRNAATNLKKKFDKDIQIHCSKQDIGITNTFGGKWSTISDLIKDCWQGMEVTIYA
tara:strand:+ start:1409 stop:1936 length:528 start_codon:yes stop_codon:yes gene_type:complete